MRIIALALASTTVASAAIWLLTFVQAAHAVSEAFSSALVEVVTVPDQA